MRVEYVFYIQFNLSIRLSGGGGEEGGAKKKERPSSAPHPHPLLFSFPLPLKRPDTHVTFSLTNVSIHFK